MLKWPDIIQFTQEGNPTPHTRIEKTEQEWRNLLDEETYRVTRQQGTEYAFSSDMCHIFEPGYYACRCCNTTLFDASSKFDSKTGWPSFTQPITPSCIAYHNDHGLASSRIEVTCNSCDAHLGHVFPDGPHPSGLRYCINALALQKTTPEDNSDLSNTKNSTATATFGGGCFWCTEALFQHINGVLNVSSGYSGGLTKNPTYKDVCAGNTGHAEVIQLTYNPEIITYSELLSIHLSSHDPTTLNQQGADKGTQYRSVILPHNIKQEEDAKKVILTMQEAFDNPIVTSIETFESFYIAEEHHQNYYRSHSKEYYCQAVINPKLNKLREKFMHKMTDKS